MHAGRFVFSQVMDYATAFEFDRCVDRYHGNSRVREFTCWDQFLCMAFAQLTGKDSLRDISTTIDLCLALYPWARFRQHKAAVKLHTLRDLRGTLPCFIRVSQGKLHEVNSLDDLVLEPGAFYGTSDNAVKTQVWIAVAVYVIIALVRKQLRVARTPPEILQILTMTLFDKVDIQHALATFVPQNPERESHKQLLLFGF